MSFFNFLRGIYNRLQECIEYRILYFSKTRISKSIMKRHNPLAHYVYIQFYDACRIGNQMFFLSFGEKLHQKYGWEIRYWTKKDNFVRFVDSFIYERCQLYINDRLDYVLHIEEYWNIDASSFEISESLKTGNVLISGSYEDLSLHDETIYRRLFECPSLVKKKINDYYGDLSEYVSIHVRRGDFVYLGIALDSSYYLRALEVVRYKLSPRKFKIIIVSDDIEWCKHNFSGTTADNLIFADRHKKDKDSTLIDLFLPSFCSQGNIISSSTFCFWGAALNSSNKSICVEPEPWSNDKSKLFLENAVRFNISP